MVVLAEEIKSRSKHVGALRTRVCGTTYEVDFLCKVNENKDITVSRYI